MKRIWLGFVVLVSFAFATPATAQQPLRGIGFAEFGNLQGFLADFEEDIPYRGFTTSNLGRIVLQSGAIDADGPPLPVMGDPSTLVFTGVMGDNPFFGLGNGKIHPLITRGGIIFTTWTAAFTIEIDPLTGLAIFSGDGQFTILGGTGRYRNASGAFRTLFRSFPTPLTADSAVAFVTQNGVINF
jgi:hypothetical protein